jgi:hypothetical protein
MEVLQSHTSGQIRLLALASMVNYHNFKARMDKDKQPSRETPSMPATTQHEIIESVKPKKPFKQMTKNEIENYYLSQGAGRGSF